MFQSSGEPGPVCHFYKGMGVPRALFFWKKLNIPRADREAHDLLSNEAREHRVVLKVACTRGYIFSWPRGLESRCKLFF